MEEKFRKFDSDEKYVNVVPYDRSRVKLQRLKDNDYINANLVTVPKAARQYILTQGPLPETVGHFWLMVWEQKSSVIVMLNKVLEMEEFVKCEEYWPRKEGVTNVHDDVNMSVTMDSIQNFKHYTLRTMTLVDNETKKSRTIQQFQYTAWPDHGHPESPTSLLRLIIAVRRAGGLYKMDEPTVVHCSAGIGRSGTFCLIDSVLNMVESQGSTEGIDIDNMLTEMRDYRMGLIQSPSQLKFAYMTIIYGIKILEKANKLHPHISICQDNIAFDNGSSSQQQRVNGSSQTNGKKPRRNKRKQNSTSNTSGSLNIFGKNLLADALDDIDSDSADSLFDEAMKPWPNMKKARNSAPEDAQQFREAYSSQLRDQFDLSANELSTEDKAKLLDRAINNLLTPNTISANAAPSGELSSERGPGQSDSALLRRRERELRNQRLAERTTEMVRKLKEDTAKREISSYRWSFFKRSALYGSVAALLLSSAVYMYMR